MSKKYKISYTFREEKVHKSYGNWYEAIKFYYNIHTSNLYRNIKTNLKVDNLILDAVGYNIELERNLEIKNAEKS
tara:strand:- start:12509 stop:12733 length:225 start_codon:yes stop_codon:yes gene_type:complete